MSVSPVTSYMQDPYKSYSTGVNLLNYVIFYWKKYIKNIRHYWD